MVALAIGDKSHAKPCGYIGNERRGKIWIATIIGIQRFIFIKQGDLCIKRVYVKRPNISTPGPCYFVSYDRLVYCTSGTKYRELVIGTHRSCPKQGSVFSVDQLV